ncbi:hypothetical protein [Aquimarina sp. I32.4]|nr:hypothetical protein [Aquimarina sp. I32.4]
MKQYDETTRLYSKIEGWKYILRGFKNKEETNKRNKTTPIG